jgi:hypothetical protein
VSRRRRSGRCGRLAEAFLEPACCFLADFGIENDVEVGCADTRDIGGGGPERGDQIDVDPKRVEHLADLDQVVPVAKAQRRGTEQIGQRLAAIPRRGAHRRIGQRTNQLVEGF